MTFLDYKVFILPESEKYFSAISGLGKKGVLVVYLNENSPALDEFLKKILAATQMDIENDLFLLSIPNETLQNKKPFLRFTDLKSQYPDLKNLIFFGINASQIGLNVEVLPYNPFQLGECQFLFVDTLSKINTQKEAKVALWGCLQAMFL